MIKNKKGGAGIVILIILLLLIFGGIVLILINSGTAQKALDPCEKNFSDCNHNCGDGILSSICKEKCTWEHNNCKNG